MKKLHRGDEIISPAGDEKTSPHTTNLNLNDTATSSEQLDLNEKPPSEDEKEEAAAIPTPEKIKDAMSALDKRLFFDKDFYPRAAAFISRHKIGLKYFEWLHEQCELKKPASFDGLYFTLFFAENMVEKYKALSKTPQSVQPPPSDDVKCPVCGTVHDKNAEMCRNCSLPKDSTPQNISLFRELLTFPLERRSEYLKRENVIYSEFKWDFEKLKTMIKNLRNEFGVKTKIVQEFELKAEHE